MNEDADRFAFRAQVCQRGVELRQRHLFRYLFSHLLNLLAGYGYHPERSFFWYLVTVGGFSWAYVVFGHIDGHAFSWHEALVFSLTSFHGRGFFPGGLSLDDPVTTMAAAEAVVGLFIEISFIATFTQRFFAR